MARLPRLPFVRVCADGAKTIPARMTSPRPTAACPGQRTTWAEISISKTKHLPPQALSGANRLADTFVRNIMHGNLGGEAEEWSLDEALGCMEAFHVLEALPESGVRCICSSVIAQSSSRMLRAFTPFRPVWFVTINQDPE